MFIRKCFILYTVLSLCSLFGKQDQKNQTLDSAVVPSIEQAPKQQPTFVFKKKKDKTIVPVCTSFALHGDNAVVGKTMFAGMKNFLKHFRKISKKKNAEANGYKLIHKGNNAHVGRKSLKKIKKLLKKSPIFLGLLGTDTFLQLQPFIEKNEITLLFPTEGTTLVRNKLYNNIIYFRPSHEKELQALAHYSIMMQRKKKVAVVYEASEWGESVLVSLKKVLKSLDIELLTAESYPQGTVEISRAVEKIAATSPNAVFCLANPRAAYSFIRNGINAGLHKCLFLGLSFLQSIQKLLKKSRGLDVVVTSVVPNSETSTIPLIQEYKKSMKSFLSFRDDSPFYLEAYIAGALFAHCLSKIQGELTIAKIITCLESFNNVEFKGLKLNFNQDDRSLSSSIWINPGLGQDWIMAPSLGVS